MEERDFDSPAHQFLQGLDALSRGKILVRHDHFQQSVLNQSESIPAKDFARIVAFCADQLGRWNAEWLFSPASTPDSDAACEKEAWEAEWETASDIHIKTFPAVSAKLKKEKDLVCIRMVLEKRLEYNQGKPIADFTSKVLSRVGLLLIRMGLKSTGGFFYKRALFPSKTVGRSDHGGQFSQIVLR